jgi:hypothetical protein
MKEDDELPWGTIRLPSSFKNAEIKFPKCPRCNERPAQFGEQGALCRECRSNELAETGVKFKIELEIDAHNRREHDALGMLRGVVREGVSVTLKADLTEGMAKACLQELDTLVTAWQRRAKGIGAEE